MVSFNDPLDILVSTLQNDAALKDFCRTAWSRALTVKRLFKWRTEISPTERPFIAVTRPSVENKYEMSGGRQNGNTVRLYLAFQQDDREKAQRDVITFEELVDDALTNNVRLKNSAGNPTVKSMYPTQSANDEGMFHPYYHIVKDVEIEHVRRP